MAATADQVARLRRMVAERTTDTYLDTDLEAAIERYPLVDANGESPEVPGADGLMETNENWTATYDLNAAAADIWAEKAAGISANFDFSADGGSYTRSQAYQQFMQNSRYYMARRSAKTRTLQPEPKPENDYTVN